MPAAFTPRSCFNFNLDSISRLDSHQCVTTCNILKLPSISLDPDQRDTLFPPSTPNQDVNPGSGACIPAIEPTPPPGGLVTIGSTDVSTQITALSDTWTRTVNPDASIKLSTTVLTRFAFDAVSGNLYGYFRTYDYDTCNSLIKISAETRVTLISTAPCP